MSVDISLNVRLDQLRAELGKIPGLTEREVKQAVRGAELQWKRMPQAAARAARESAQQFERRLAGIRQVSANTFGDVVNDIGDVVEVLGTLPPPAMAAAGSLIAIGAGAAGIAAVSYAMFTLVDGAQEARQSLADLEKQGVLTLNITDEQSEAMQEYEDATQLARAQLTALRVEVAARLMPAWRDAAVAVLAAGLALRDIVDVGARFKQTLDETVGEAEGLQRLANAVVTLGASEAYRAGYQGMKQLGDAVAGAGDESGTYLERAIAMLDALGKTRDAANDAAAAMDAVGRATGRGRQGADTSRADEAEQARMQRQLDNLERMRRQIMQAETAFMSPLDAIDARMELELHALFDWLEEMGGVPEAVAIAEQRRNQIERAAAEERQQIMQAAADQEIEAQRQIRLARIASTQAIVSGAADAIAAIDETSRFARAAGLAESLVNFGTAITSAFAQGGPIGGPALAALVVGQLSPVISSMRALVGGGPSAPAFGGAGGGGGGGGRPFGRSEYGFTGTDGRGNTIMVAEYRSEIYDAQSYDAIRRPGSPLRDLSRRQRVSR